MAWSYNPGGEYADYEDLFAWLRMHKAMGASSTVVGIRKLNALVLRAY
jgi:hypothetical protein